MRLLVFVVLPLLLHLMVAAAGILANTGNGSFAGLGIMLLTPPAVLVTALINVLSVRRQPVLGWAELTLRTLLWSLVFPVLVLLLAILPT